MHLVQHVLCVGVSKGCLDLVRASNRDSLIPRTPAGRAATSAAERTAWILSASIFSLPVRSGLLSSVHSLMTAAGAMLVTSLTVPWPPDRIQGVRSAMSPSRRRNGNRRVALMVESLLMVEDRRTSLPRLPPHLEIWVSVRSGRDSLCRSAHVRLTPQRFGAWRMMASTTDEDASWPAEFTGKL